MKRNRFLDTLLEHRFRGDDAIRDLLNQPISKLKSTNPLHPKSILKKKPTAANNSNNGPKYFKGVHNGNYYRIKIPPPPPKSNILPNLPVLPSVHPAPTSFKTMIQDHQKRGKNISQIFPQAKGMTSEQQQQEVPKNAFMEWIKNNWAVMVLNCGSICILIGFTRSDVLELRTLSAIGSIGNMIFRLAQPAPILWMPVAWPAMFASVNFYKIHDIMQEQHAHVQLSEEDYNIYIRYFMPHGITPKQFEKIMDKAEWLEFPKGTRIITKGHKVEHVFLVIEGSTQAHILGRHLTASSTSKQSKKGGKAGGDSGAWIGEMAFLDKMWEKEQAKIANRTKIKAKVLLRKKKQENNESNGVETEQEKKIVLSANELMSGQPTITATMPTETTSVFTTTTSTETLPTTSTSVGSSTSGATATTTITRTLTTAINDNSTQSNETTTTETKDKEIEEEKQADTDNHDEKTEVNEQQKGLHKPSKSAFCTIFAKEDVTLLRWTHEDMEELMGRSADLRGGLTRAMSSAIVGKVVNMTVSRTSALPTWSAWLDDWNRRDGAAVNVESVRVKNPQKLPSPPIDPFAKVPPVDVDHDDEVMYEP